MKNETEQTHPLKVYYPYGGKHFMLRWQEHSIGQQLVLAKSKTGIFNTAKSIIKKYPHSNFCEFSSIEIVAPSDKVIQWAINTKHQDDVERFFQNAMMKVSDAFYSKNMDLIALFKACPDSDLEHKYHYCGDNDCIDGIMLNNLSKEEFYNKFIDDWNKKYPPCDIKNPGVYSLAEKASERSNLYFAKNCHGIEIKKVESEYTYYDTVLFYYHKEKTLNKKFLEPLLDEVKAQQKERDERNAKAEQLRAEEYEKKQKEEAMFVAEFFESRM